jgi:flagellum-specific ATP synthase
MRARLAARQDAEDLIMLGAYRSGANPDVDAALRSEKQIRELMTQKKDEGTDLDTTVRTLLETVETGNEEKA